MEQSDSEQRLNSRVLIILIRCLRDEVQVTGATLRAALDQVARQEGRPFMISGADLYRGKFGALLTEVVESGFFSDSGDWERYRQAMAAAPDTNVSELSDDLTVSLEESLLCADRARQSRAALTCMHLAYGYSPNVQSRRPPLPSPESQALAQRFRRLRDALGRIVCGNDLRVAVTAAWALAWTGAARLPNSPPSRDVLLSLYRLWRTESGELQSLAAWAFRTQPLFPRGAFKASDFPDAAAVLKLEVPRSHTGAYVLAWYRREPWDDAELLRRIGELDHVRDATILELARSFGTAGEVVLNELLKKSETARGYYQLLDAP